MNGRYKFPQVLGGLEHEGIPTGLETKNPTVRFFGLNGLGDYVLELPLRVVKEVPLWEFGRWCVSLPPMRTHVLVNGPGGANLSKHEALAFAKALTAAAELVVDS